MLERDALGEGGAADQRVLEPPAGAGCEQTRGGERDACAGQAAEGAGRGEQREPARQQVAEAHQAWRDGVEGLHAGRRGVIGAQAVKVASPQEQAGGQGQYQDGRGKVLLEREYYSVGGGFIEWKGFRPEPRGRPKYPYATALQLRAQLQRHHLSLHALVLENEQAVTGLEPERIRERLDATLDAMAASVKRGIVTEGFLPGPIHLHRKGALLFQRAQKMGRSPERFLVYLSAYAFAAAEENAAGHTIVTAPTCGSAGVMPAVLHFLRHHKDVPLAALRNALLSSAAIGFIIRHGASISGAEVGCQGEIGVASAMAAAFLAGAHDQPFVIMENAAETALEHHLGMTCDPVRGYVQIPCIERNAMGAVKAYTAYTIACGGIPEWHIVGLDNAVKAMAMTGRDMSCSYKETALGGLAKSC